MMLVSCSEIFRPHGVIDVKLLVESHSLGYVLCCLSSKKESYRSIAKAFLTAVFNYLNISDDKSVTSTYKERLAVKLLIGKVLTFIEAGKMLPSLAYFLGNILQIITRPNHFLHEKATEFLMSGPSLLPSEIPLFKAITRTSSETAVKQYLWLLQSLRDGVSSSEDVDFYFKRGVFEWAMGLHTLPRSKSIKQLVEHLIARCQELPSTSMSLVSRNGALAWVDSLPCSEVRSKLGLRFVLSTNKQKLEAWTGVPAATTADALFNM
jgi:hypothetical protein